MIGKFIYRVQFPTFGHGSDKVEVSQHRVGCKLNPRGKAIILGSQEWEDLGPYGLHIHCPDAAMPKDGPSAGITITTAILSRLSNLKIKNTIAMTGEIDLNGKVHKIGGLDSKLNGARKAGVTKVLIPIDNKSDLDLILKDYNETEKKEYFNNFEVLPVSNIKEVIKESFLDDFPFNN